jgi:hypothetical protein
MNILVDRNEIFLTVEMNSARMPGFCRWAGSFLPLGCPLQ